MNFKMMMAASALMAFAGVVAAGCGGNKCEAAADDAAAKLESCGATVATATATGTAPECTEAAGTLAECQAACIVAAPCHLLVPDMAKPPTAEEAKAFGDCVTACSK